MLVISNVVMLLLTKYFAKKKKRLKLKFLICSKNMYSFLDLKQCFSIFFTFWV